MNGQMMNLLLQMMLSQNVTEKAAMELKKLDYMLTAAGVPHEMFGNRQICYYGKNGRPQPEDGRFYGAGVGAVCSVIASGYGADLGLLEISGLMTEEEYRETNDTVLGYLTADNIFGRIYMHYISEM